MRLVALRAAIPVRASRVAPPIPGAVITPMLGTFAGRVSARRGLDINLSAVRCARIGPALQLRLGRRAGRETIGAKLGRPVIFREARRQNGTQHEFGGVGNA
jgi:hypothetical protein